MTDTVRTEADDGVLVITIDRPAARNAIDAEVAAGLATAADRLDADPGLRVGILTGAGGYFCAGMDLKAFVSGEDPFVPGRGFGGLVERPPRKPLIAAIEGFAMAGGLEIALACDLVVAARGARLGVPEVRRALVAAGGALIRLPRRIPYHVAMELALTGDPIDAERGYELGIVNRLAQPGDALAVARELAAAISRNGPLAVDVSKQVILETAGRPEPEAWEAQRPLVAPIFASDDAREGATAFAEKREPVWRGR